MTDLKDMTLDELVELRETRRREVFAAYHAAEKIADDAHALAMCGAIETYDNALETIEDELRPLIDAAEKVKP